MRNYIRSLIVALFVLSMTVFSGAGTGQAAPGDFLFQWGTLHLLPDPNSVAIDSAGNTYITEEDFHRISVFDKSGKLIRSWGSYGSGNGQLSYPSDVAVAGTMIYVVDKGNNRIQVFDNTGTYIRQWGGLGSADGLFNSPEGVAIDSRGNIYVADTQNYRVQIFDSSGNFITTLPVLDPEGGAYFYWPTDIAFDSAGNVYVADYERIQIFDSTGKFLRSWLNNYGLPFYEGIAIDSADNIYVDEAVYDDYVTYVIRVYDVSGNYLREWGGFGIDAGKFMRALGVAVDTNRSVYVADTGNDRVQVFDSSGKLLRIIGGTNADGQFKVPHGIATDASGNVYVADTDNYRVQVFDNGGNFIRKFGGFQEILYPYGPYSVALDRSGRIYVGYSDSYYDTKIQVYDSSGNYLRNFNLYPYGVSPRGIAVDATGNIYVANYSNDQVLVYDNGGTILRTWGSSGSANGQFLNPFGLALDGSGNVYVADSNNHRIQVFSSTGTFLRSWGSEGVADGQFYHPTWVAIDGAGNVYVTDSGAGAGISRIQVFTSTGSFLGKWGAYGIGEGQFLEPAGVAASISGGTAYVVDSALNRVQAYAGFGDQLPAGWVGRDIGSVGVAGRASYANGTFTLQGSGANIWGTTDAFHFVYRPLTGDGQIVARVTSVQNTNGYAKGGVMIRESLAANSVHAMVDIEATAGAEFSRRLTTGGSTTVTGAAGIAAPEWVKLVRQGNTFSGYLSKDGVTWTLVGSSTIGMASTVYVGLIVNSHNNTTLCTSTIDAVSLAGQTNTPGVTITTPTSGASYTAPATVPISATATATSGAVINKVDFYAGSTLIGTANSSPYSVTWSNVPAGSYSLTAKVTDSYGGTATSSPVAITVNSTALPTPWVTQDVGSVGVAGSASYANGTFTVKGSGANIYGTADAFRFVYQPMTGDAQIVARVVSVQNTNTYAKAGVMIRQSLTANSAHAMMDITPTSGAEFSRRTTAGGSTTPTARTGIAAPYWVKLVRSGSTFTGSISSDGVTWSQVGSASISMTGTVYVGLIVNSHNNTVLCTGAFDSVALTGGGVDLPPTVTAFTIPATSSLLTVPITTFTATDDHGVTGYLVTESSTKPSARASGWSPTPPASHTFTTSGTKTLYAWAKDAAGNVSNSRSATVTISTGGLPSPWLTQDIGSVGVIGSASYANGIFTLKGSGADIWGTADAFRFVYKVMTGDGQIIARVASLQNTNSYAKGGVMMRQSLAANSMHAMMDLRPTGGGEFSRRTSTGGTTTATTRTGVAAPYWVRLVRSGNTFTGSVSSDGVTWSQVGSASISMTSSIYVGLIVNSHSNSVLCTTTIDGVK